MASEYEDYFIFDDPIPYKNLLVYPVLMKDYIKFHKNIDAFLFNKNRIPNPEIIQMSYFEFLWYISVADDKSAEYIYKALEILKLCLKFIKTIYQDQDGNELDEPIYIEEEIYQVDISLDENYKPFLIINGEKYTKKDFKQLRRIICEQNSIELPEDNKMNPEMEKVLMEAQAFINRTKNHFKICSLEDQIICVMISLNCTAHHIKNNISIRKFQKILHRVDAKLHYEIYKTAEMSGFVKFKDNSSVKHWLSDLHVDKFANVKTDYEGFIGKTGLSVQQVSLNKEENNV
jgi:hypothetical protein